MVLALLLVLVAIPVSADNGNRSKAPGQIFKDIEEGFWAFPAIQNMVERGVLQGFEDNTFRPNALVTRAEFAKMMVVALGLDTPKVTRSEFIDVQDKHWALPYIEAARPYLTGYQTASGIKFKPTQAAVREDMAVALVGALKLPQADLSILNSYADVELISESLRPYVATAIANNVIVGVALDGKKYFNPIDDLTRAEAAQLLANVLVEQEKKILLPGDSKIPLPSKEGVTLKAEALENGFRLMWSQVPEDSDFKYYKVVASLKDQTPEYPSNGYIRAFSDEDDDNLDIKVGMSANGTDFKNFEAGKTYYLAVTTVYENGVTKTSNVLALKMPQVAQYEPEKKAPVLQTFMDGDRVKIYWQGNVAQDQLQYYKVVASLSDSTPEYPTNGYAAYFTDASADRMYIEDGTTYNGNEFSAFESNKTYYFAVTTVFKDGTKLTSNVIAVKIP